MSPLNCARVCTYSTRIVRESSTVRVGACRGPGGSWEVSMVICELLEQPIEVHALRTRTWVEYTPSPETNTHRQWWSKKACTHTQWLLNTKETLNYIIKQSFTASRTFKSLCVYWNIPFSSGSAYFFPFLSLTQNCSPSVSQLHSSSETWSILVYTV